MFLILGVTGVLFLFSILVGYLVFVVAWSLPRMEDKQQHRYYLIGSLLSLLLFPFIGPLVFPIFGFSLGYGISAPLSKGWRTFLIIVGVVLLLCSGLGLFWIAETVLDLYSN